MRRLTGVRRLFDFFWGGETNMWGKCPLELEVRFELTGTFVSRLQGACNRPAMRLQHMYLRGDSFRSANRSLFSFGRGICLPSTIRVNNRFIFLPTSGLDTVSWSTRTTPHPTRLWRSPQNTQWNQGYSLISTQRLQLSSSLNLCLVRLAYCSAVPPYISKKCISKSQYSFEQATTFLISRIVPHRAYGFFLIPYSHQLVNAVGAALRVSCTSALA